MTDPDHSLLDDDVFDHVSAALADAPSLEDALTLIMQRTCDVLAVHQAVFFIVDPGRATLRLLATSGDFPVPSVVVSAHTGLLGSVLRRGHPRTTNNAARDRHGGEVTEWIGDIPADRVPAIAAVPVRTTTGLAGVLVVIELLAEHDQATSASEQQNLADYLPFLLVLADLVALALEHRSILRVQERRSAFIQLLQIIATRPDSEPVEELAQTITTHVCTITQAELACIFLHSPATDELIALGISDTPLGQLQRVSGLDHLPLATSGPLLDVFQDGIPRLIGPGPDLERLSILPQTGIQSLLVVPLQLASAIQGLIVLLSTTATAFSADDLSFLSFLSTRLGYALRHETLADELATLEQARIQQDIRESFISLVAHDLKNALTTIAGSGHLALRRAGKGEVAYSQKALHIMVSKAAQATQLVNDMVDVNNMEHGRFRLFMAPLDLVEIVREEVEAAQAQTTRHTLALVTSVETLAMVGDSQRLRQVLSNVLTNAIHYAPAGGEIRIELHLLPPVGADQAAGDTDAVPLVSIAIIDQGMGISPTDLPHIFDRLYRGRGAGVTGGSGLGLAIASTIVSQHGGTIDVESVVDVGTRIQLTLPVRG